jgi:hypothetical protein
MRARPRNPLLNNGPAWRASRCPAIPTFTESCRATHERNSRSTSSRVRGRRPTDKPPIRTSNAAASGKPMTGHNCFSRWLPLWPTYHDKVRAGANRVSRRRKHDRNHRCDRLSKSCDRMPSILCTDGGRSGFARADGGLWGKSRQLLRHPVARQRWHSGCLADG